MSNNKQSSINLFIEQLELIAHLYEETEGVNKINVSIDVNEYLALKQQAKEMEKEQTINFTEDWYFNGPLLGEGIDVKNTIEQHFNKTYGGGEQ